MLHANSRFYLGENVVTTGARLSKRRPTPSSQLHSSWIIIHYVSLAGWLAPSNFLHGRERQKCKQKVCTLMGATCTRRGADIGMLHKSRVYCCWRRLLRRAVAHCIWEMDHPAGSHQVKRPPQIGPNYYVAIVLSLFWLLSMSCVDTTANVPKVI